MNGAPDLPLAPSSFSRSKTSINDGCSWIGCEPNDCVGPSLRFLAAGGGITSVSVLKSRELEVRRVVVADGRVWAYLVRTNDTFSFPFSAIAWKVV